VNAGPTRILIVDDSALYRQSIQNVLREVADVSIVGTAKNGVEALEKIEEFDPDLLTLDVQMPDMDGIRVLHEMKRRRMRAKAIMVSNFTTEGAQVTTEALMEGAFDFVVKPSSKDSAANRQQLLEALAVRISAFRQTANCGPPSSRPQPRVVAAGGVVDRSPVPAAACQAVILGTSTGGPKALKTVLPRLPASLHAPILVVQHMPAQYTRSLAARLNDICELEILEAEDLVEAKAGRVFIAPGGKQAKLEWVGRTLAIRVTDDSPENGVRPSVDYLLRSAVDVLNGNALAVIMTGMGRDGLAGCRLLKQAGGYVFAQCQQDCVVYGMPKAVIEEGLVARALPLGKIAPAIVRHVNRSRRKS
jgi:two-component system chemotaxis response regulator CheB